MALNVKLTIKKVKIREQCLIEQMKNYIIKFFEMQNNFNDRFFYFLYTLNERTLKPSFIFRIYIPAAT